MTASAGLPGIEKSPCAFLAFDDGQANPIGRACVLAFYPGDCESVRGEQLALYSAGLDGLEALDAEIFGGSVDSVESHIAFVDDRGDRFRLLADDDRKGEVPRAFGSFTAEKKIGPGATCSPSTRRASCAGRMNPPMRSIRHGRRPRRG